MRLPGIDRLVEFVNAKGRGCHVFKKDLRRAYRQIPIDPQDYPLLGLYIDGSLYFHTALPSGLRSATMICQHTTKSVAYILNTDGISVDVYIDDFYGAESTDSSDLSFQRMNSLFAELGLMDAPEKDSPPSHEMLCLGIWMNTLDMTLSVPAFRVEELQLELNTWLTKCSFTKRELRFRVRSTRQGLHESSLKCSSFVLFGALANNSSNLRGSSREHKLVAVLSLAV